MSTQTVARRAPAPKNPAPGRATPDPATLDALAALVALSGEVGDLVESVALSRLALVGTVREVVSLQVDHEVLPDFFEHVDGALWRLHERLRTAFYRVVELEAVVCPALRRRAKARA